MNYAPVVCPKCGYTYDKDAQSDRCPHVRRRRKFRDRER